MDPAQAEAVRATGAGWLQWLNYSVQPQVMPRMIGLGLYRFDINFRESAVVGIVGVRLQHSCHHRTGYVPGVVSRTWPRGRLFRSEERRVGTEWVSTGRSRGGTAI